MTTRIVTDSNGRKHITNEPLLHPPAREWVGLTDEEIWKLAANCLDSVAGRLAFARAVEAKLKEKNA